jgi:hypothetical protein
MTASNNQNAAWDSEQVMASFRVALSDMAACYNAGLQTLAYGSYARRLREFEPKVAKRAIWCAPKFYEYRMPHAPEVVVIARLITRFGFRAVSHGGDCWWQNMDTEERRSFRMTPMAMEDIVRAAYNRVGNPELAPPAALLPEEASPSAEPVDESFQLEVEQWMLEHPGVDREDAYRIVACSKVDGIGNYGKEKPKPPRRSRQEIREWLEKEIAAEAARKGAESIAPEHSAQEPLPDAARADMAGATG